MTINYLITGATGGLGGLVLEYFVANVALTEFAASSSNINNRSLFESRGINFRHLDYEDPSTLDTALQGVKNMLFVSTNTSLIYPERIRTQHQNVVNAAKKANVEHVGHYCLLSIILSPDSLILDLGMVYLSAVWRSHKRLASCRSTSSFRHRENAEAVCFPEEPQLQERHLVEGFLTVL